MTKTPDNVDRHVGSRIRMRRTSIGISQEKLAAALGVTFQQVQKYEKGTNRVSASRLRLATQVLGVPIDFFYEGLAGAEAGPGGGAAPGFAEAGVPYDADAGLTPQGLQLVRAFTRIPDAKMRRRLVELIEAIADAAPR